MASEVDQILIAMESGSNFILNGGAGSGKTHTLIELIQNINKRTPKAKIACITYTNVAADEITIRAQSESLKASTIHDFLWDNIKGFQINLKQAIVALNESVSEDDLEDIREVQYREFKSLKKGIVSHKDVISISEYLFDTFPLLAKIISDKFDYVFVDEYQDTSSEVINILFTKLSLKTFDIRVGLMGDSMQSIYDGIGEVNTGDFEERDDNREFVEIRKELNRRCPQKVIDLANKLRTDKLEQKPKINGGAPNNKADGSIKEGTIKFLYSSSENATIEDVRNSKYCINWDVETSNELTSVTKELFTRNSDIAKQAKFNSLFEIYTKDKIIGSGGFIRNKTREYLKHNDVDIDLNHCTLIELLDEMIGTIDASLDFKHAMTMVKKEKENHDTTQKALNAVKKVYAGIDKILPARSMFDFIIENEDLFDIALNTTYEKLSKTFIDKDKLIGKKKSKNELSNSRNDEKDALMKHLTRVQEVIVDYNDNEISKVIEKVDFKIRIGKDKSVLKNRMQELNTTSKGSIQDVIQFVEHSGLFNYNARTVEFFDGNSYLLERIGRVSYSEIVNLYNYIEGVTPYSTQHGVKGDEFDNVLEVIEDDKTPNISVCYKYLFEDTENQEKYILRTRNLFYVVCTRAKENLVVFYQGNCSTAVLDTAKEWFGSKEVIDIDNVK